MALRCLSYINAARLSKAVKGKVCLITGASRGIGATLARRLAAAGAHVVLVARGEAALREVGDAIRAAGGEATEYIADLADEADCARLVREVLIAHGGVDVFVSNAGRSIRRSAKWQSGRRFHDITRLTKANFFSGMQVALGLLPGMIQRGSGHIIHVSSASVPCSLPRFSAYGASKSAFDAALKAIASEVSHKGVSTSSVYMPYVDTKMVQAPGLSYNHVWMLTADQACEYIEHAIVGREVQVLETVAYWYAMAFYLQPAIAIAVNRLLYLGEGERIPDGLGTINEAIAATRRKATKRRTKPSCIVNAVFKLVGLLSFTDRLFFIHLRVPWIFRNVICCASLLCVVVMWQIVTLISVPFRLARRITRCRRRHRGDTCDEEAPNDRKPASDDVASTAPSSEAAEEDIAV